MRQPRHLVPRRVLPRAVAGCARAARPRLARADAPAAPAHPTAGIAAELARASQRGQFRLVYQPICSMREPAPPAFEALLRWDHPWLGSVAPDDFIGLAEHNGLILDIGDWVFRSAAEECLRLRRATDLPVRVAVNVSALQLASRAAMQLWLRHLHGIGLPADALTLEITERVMSRRPEAMCEHLAELRAAGLRISLDDFGTGYSNLAMLGQAPIDTLKLDRSLTRCLADSQRHRTIARSIVELAHQLRIQVVAEGVENPAQAWISSEMGCDFAQGFWYGRPVPASQLALTARTAVA